LDVTPYSSLGRLLIVAGLVAVVAGVVILVFGRLPRVPGDVVIQRPNLTVYVPIGTMILASLALTLLLNLFLRR
jgi:hypothetical protein